MRPPLLVPALALVAAAWLFAPPPAPPPARDAAVYDGVVTGDVVRRGDIVGFTFATGALTVRTTVRGRVVPGQRVRIDGALRPFEGARNFGDAPIPHPGIDELLIRAHLVRTGDVARDDVRAWPARARAAASARLHAFIPSPEAEVLDGALLGERGALPDELDDDFRATGTVHVLITAGLHLGTLAAALLALFALVGVPRVAAALTVIPCVIAYASLTGAHLPSERAACMTTLVLLARAWGARPLSFNTIAAAAIGVVLLDPQAPRGVSFALSFSCVCAIACFAGPIARRLSAWHVPAALQEPLALTAATQIGVWPLSASVFGTLAPYALLANAIAVPATCAALVAGAASLAVPIAAPLATLAVDVLLHAVTWTAQLPGAHAAVAPPPPWLVVVYDAAAVACAALLRRRAALGILLLAAAASAVLAGTLRLPPRAASVTTLDVGQGDAHVVRLTDGSAIVIDTGGTLERGPDLAGRSPAERAADRVVLPYLRREGIAHVALLVITHPHGDHAGGCRGIIETFAVDELLDSGQAYGGRAARDCLSAAARHHVAVRIARAPMQWHRAEATFDVLAPASPPITDGRDDVNENSIVAMLTLAGPAEARWRMLFTGDAGLAAEARLLRSGTDLRADVLKAGHHGSRFASTPAFVRAVAPRVAVISVGRDNRFGHPALRTLKMYRSVGATVYRTDRCGAVRFTFGASIETVRPCAR